MKKGDQVRIVWGKGPNATVTGSGTIVRFKTFLSQSSGEERRRVLVEMSWGEIRELPRSVVRPAL